MNLKESHIHTLFLPVMTVFMTSFCIMVVELIAGRIVARYLGASLYTWTSIIGVVLIGIVVGNYTGGVLADRKPPQKILSVFFILASVSCMMVPFLNKVMGEFHALWPLPWPIRITLHMLSVFLLPSIMLGAIAPLITKLALDKGLAVGITVGSVYAWSSLGSIAGTFITGFVLIPHMGTLFIIYALSAILALLGVLYSLKSRMMMAPSAAIFGLLIFLALTPHIRSEGCAQGLPLWEEISPAVIYQKESSYSYITVERSERNPSIRNLIIDRLLHSVVDMRDPGNLDSVFQYPYIRLYGALTEVIAPDKGPARVLVLGGGGYVFPRYLEKRWPKSVIDVVEIDPAITQAAQEALGFSPSKAVSIYHMDARYYVGDTVRKLKVKEQEPAVYDFIFCDAVSGLSVPYQLTTSEFMGDIKELLGGRGVFVMTLIDNYRSGTFLGAVVRTLRAVFSHTYVFTGEMLIDSDYARNTFTIVSAQYPLDLSGILNGGFTGKLLDDNEVELFLSRSDIILSDDYAPVDYLIEPLIKQRAREFAGARLADKGNSCAKEGDFYKAIEYYEKALSIFPDFFIAHNNLGNVLAQLGKPEQALRHFREALRIVPALPDAYSNSASVLAAMGELDQAEHYFMTALGFGADFPQVHYNFASFLVTRGRTEEARAHYQRALGLQEDFPEADVGIANILVAEGKTDEAMEHYRRALSSKPDYAQARNNLGVLLLNQGKIKEAVKEFKEALFYAPDYRDAQQNLHAACNVQEAR